jgi:peptidoglycan/LPS O-acetylase OafA/YrhL
MIGLGTWRLYLAIISLAGVKSRKTDQWAGDFSYPVYLLHTTVAAWFLPVFGYGRSFLFFASAFAATMLVSWALIVLVDQRVQHLKLEGRLTRKTPTVSTVTRIAA